MIHSTKRPLATLFTNKKFYRFSPLPLVICSSFLILFIYVHGICQTHACMNNEQYICILVVKKRDSGSTKKKNYNIPTNRKFDLDFGGKRERCIMYVVSNLVSCGIFYLFMVKRLRQVYFLNISTHTAYIKEFIQYECG